MRETFLRYQGQIRRYPQSQTVSAPWPRKKGRASSGPGGNEKTFWGRETMNLPQIRASRRGLDQKGGGYRRSKRPVELLPIPSRKAVPTTTTPRKKLVMVPLAGPQSIEEVS